MEKVLSSTPVFTGHKARINAVDIDFGNGKTGTFHMMDFKDIVLGVMAIAVDNERNIYLLEQFMVGVGERLITLPKGGVPKDGVTVEEQLNNELQEEIGMKANKVTKLLEMHPFPSYVKFSSIVYLAEDLEVSHKEGDELEDLKIIKMPFTQAVEKALNGEITEARTIAAILAAKVKLGW
jgi:ADP-ribose pyrophosphatase